MFAQHRGVKSNGLPKFPARELVETGPFHRLYHNTQEDAGGSHGFQQGQDGCICAEGFLTPTYPTSHTETVSWNSACSIDLQSSIIIVANGFDDGCVGLHGSAPASFDFLGRPNFILPSINPSSLLNETTAIQDFPFNSVAFPVTTDASFAMPNLHDPLTPNKTALTESAGFDALNNIGVWDERLLSPRNDSFPVRNAGRCYLPPFIPRKWLKPNSALVYAAQLL
jgi:hypothetical protein